MANIKTTKWLMSGTAEHVLYYTLDSDGTDETNTIIYDSSERATANNYTDTLTSSIATVYAVTNVSTGATIRLFWDGTIKVLAYTVPTNIILPEQNFRPLGSLQNTADGGKTGDVLITTTGLKAHDSIMLVVCFKKV